VSYLITATVSGLPYAITCNVEDNCFELSRAVTALEVGKAFCSPNKTGAMSVLNWINQNDKDLASKGLTISPEAKLL